MNVITIVLFYGVGIRKLHDIWEKRKLGARLKSALPPAYDSEPFLILARKTMVIIDFALWPVWVVPMVVLFAVFCISVIILGVGYCVWKGLPCGARQKKAGRECQSLPLHAVRSSSPAPSLTSTPSIGFPKQPEQCHTKQIGEGSHKPCSSSGDSGARSRPDRGWMYTGVN